MNKILVVMERPGDGRMNVPIEKLGEFLDAGWKEISRAPMTGFDPSAPSPAAEGGEQKPPETPAQRRAREKAEAEAAKLAAEGGEQKPPEKE